MLTFHLHLSLPSGLFPPDFLTETLNSLPFHAYYIACPSHPPLMSNSNSILRGLQVIGLLIMQFSPGSYYSITLMSKYYSQQPVPIHTVFLAYREMLRHTIYRQITVLHVFSVGEMTTE
jgi:hypothetical protein